MLGCWEHESNGPKKLLGTSPHDPTIPENTSNTFQMCYDAAVNAGHKYFGISK